LEAGVIVAGIDGSQSALEAARWAAFDAERRGTTLRLVHAVAAPAVGGYPEPSLLAPTVTVHMRQRAARLLQTTADHLGADHPGLRIEMVQQDGPPVPVLMDQSRKAFATVVGADGVGRISGVFFGSVSARLAEHGHGCIVIARADPVAPTASDPGDVVVGVDGSPQSQAAIGFAYEEAALRGATMVAIHTWNDKPLRRGLGSYPLEIDASGIDQAQHRLLETELAGWEQKYPEVPVQLRILRGRPAPNLLRYAHQITRTNGERRTQLIVVGSRGRGGFAGLLLGSTSQAVMIHADCSVAVVHTDSGVQSRATPNPW
jgi:nucleotide-binding universal stress UspA family protein